MPVLPLRKGEVSLRYGFPPFLARKGVRGMVEEGFPAAC